MRTLTTLACLSTLLLTACGNPNEGYYDANGNYIPPANTTTEVQRRHSPSPAAHMDERYSDRRMGRYREPSDYDRYDRYDRRGYYDYNGYYVSNDDRYMDVPAGMFPPRGMCRVWFTDRVPSDQPAIESCDGIHARVPAGAYVIYGG
jgi:hypothetical protein